MQNFNTFKSVFSKYDTDKAANYSNAYENHLTPIRSDVKLLMEIGVNRGFSIRAFKEFFPNATIIGIDIDEKCYFEDDRIKIYIGDATNKHFINSILSVHRQPDIIIDDGSHFSSDIKKTFNLLYNEAKKFYIIEDLGTQFKEFNGGFYINDGEPANKIIHNQIDDLLLNKFDKSIHIYHSIAIIEK